MSAEGGAQKVAEVLRTPRRDTAQEMAAAGYEIRRAAAELQRRYEEMV